MKESYYFPHDHNARNDERVLKIRSQFNNAEGYGIYFMVIEVLAESSDGSIDASDMAPLSLSLSLPKGRLEAFLTLSISLGLFKKRGDRIYSDRMNEYKKFREERSESGRKGARSRWDSVNSSAIAKPMLEPMLIKGKERKGKYEVPDDLKESEKEILDWLEYKKEKGKTYKPKGLEAFWRVFRAIPKSKRRESVDYCMANNWDGLFEKKGESKQLGEGLWADGAEKAAQRDREAIKKKMELLKRGSMEPVNPSTLGGIQAGDGSVKKG